MYNVQYRRKNGWLRIFFRNNHSTSERTHNWNQLFLEINIPLLKELFKQWITARSPVKVNTLSFREWMTGTLSVTKTDILLQRKDDCNQSGEINRLPLKNRMPRIDLPKKQLFVVTSSRQKILSGCHQKISVPYNPERMDGSS